MDENKKRIIVNDFGHRLLVKALAEFRNQLLEENKSTDVINNLILKVIDAPKYRWWR